MLDHRIGLRQFRALSPRTKHRCVRLRGAAMIEALIALPVFLAVAIALPLLHERYAARQRAGLIARSCAFAHAYTGCAGDAPAQCAAMLGSAGSPEAGPETSVESQ